MRAVALLIILGTLASAKDHVLTIGGGFSPAGNQVSLERNVIFFEKLLAERLPAGIGHDLYFADGTSPRPDLQFQVEGEDVPEANRLMAGLFGSEDDLENQYRNNTLENVRGVSSPAEVERWFREEGSKLESGDRLILYVTAHGSRSGQKDNKFNTKIWMWDRKTIDAAKLAGLIKGLPEGVSVMSVMVQCFSGGFSHLIFEGNNAKKGGNGRSVCGFYATVCDREAAGCTPDVNEANYDEFSSHFWAALRGKTRMEEKVAGCDYDEDGRVSFEEAHAYAILTSRNIDVPVKTSDAYLRVHSKLRSKDQKDLLGHDTPYSEIARLAGPVERAVLVGLSEQLGLEGEKRGSEIKKKSDKLAEELKKLKGRMKSQKKTLDGVRIEIARAVRNRWPALENEHSPGAVRLLSDERQRAEFVKAVESHPKYAKWNELKQEREDLDAEELVLSKTYATHRRFVRAFENVVYAANLEIVAKEKVRAGYQQLLGAERGSFGK